MSRLGLDPEDLLGDEPCRERAEQQALGAMAGGDERVLEPRQPTEERSVVVGARPQARPASRSLGAVASPGATRSASRSTSARPPAVTVGSNPTSS